LVSVFGICAIISIILSLFLNDIDYLKVGEEQNFGQIGKKKKSCKLLQGRLNSDFFLVKHQANELKRQLFSIDQLLAMPINLMNAFVLTFLWVDFTRVCLIPIFFFEILSIFFY
jgi:hypothetical protein